MGKFFGFAIFLSVYATLNFVQSIKIENLSLRNKQGYRSLIDKQRFSFAQGDVNCPSLKASTSLIFYMILPPGDEGTATIANLKAAFENLITYISPAKGLTDKLGLKINQEILQGNSASPADTLGFNFIADDDTDLQTFKELVNMTPVTIAKPDLNELVKLIIETTQQDSNRQVTAVIFVGADATTADELTTIKEKLNSMKTQLSSNSGTAKFIVHKFTDSALTFSNYADPLFRAFTGCDDLDNCSQFYKGTMANVASSPVFNTIKTDNCQAASSSSTKTSSTTTTTTTPPPQSSAASTIQSTLMVPKPAPQKKATQIKPVPNPPVPNQPVPNQPVPNQPAILVPKREASSKKKDDNQNSNDDNRKIYYEKTKPNKAGDNADDTSFLPMISRNAHTGLLISLIAICLTISAMI